MDNPSGVTINIEQAMKDLSLLAPRPRQNPERSLIGPSSEMPPNVANITKYISDAFPSDKYSKLFRENARKAMLGTIHAEAGHSMNYNTWQGGATNKNDASGPGYGLFQFEMPHWRRPKKNGKGYYSRNSQPTPAEIARGFVKYDDTKGKRYNTYLKNNKFTDSAVSQTNYMSQLIRGNKKVLEAFKKGTPEKAMEAFTKYLITPGAYLNKNTRDSELSRRYKYMNLY
tara:strand:+ start:39 stop:722 length:684 start_codon:yes stop_codon:yes gene_type:complete